MFKRDAASTTTKRVAMRKHRTDLCSVLFCILDLCDSCPAHLYFDIFSLKHNFHMCACVLTLHTHTHERSHTSNAHIHTTREQTHEHSGSVYSLRLLDCQVFTHIAAAQAKYTVFYIPLTHVSRIHVFVCVCLFVFWWWLRVCFRCTRANHQRYAGVLRESRNVCHHTLFSDLISMRLEWGTL